jgi:iron complex outermembrane receptor protein
MIKRRLFAASAGSVLSAVACASGAHAQAASPPAAPPAVEEVIVTGTRTLDTTSLTSASPVHVMSSATLLRTGYSDLGRAIEFSDPSVNVPRPQTTPSSANTRPITLRGLSPDETLVLVNGKRWHTTAVVNVNFAVGRGSAPFDLSTIPEAAIDHVEILKDGAAAQYGSDAIAGVVNIILKSGAAGGYVDAQGSITEKGDGGAEDVQFTHGFALGSNGASVTVSGEFGHQEPTNRAADDLRVDPLTGQPFDRRTFRIGDPRVTNAGLTASAVYPLPQARTELYADLLASRKDSENAVTFNLPNAKILPLQSAGFLPLINPVIWDGGDTVGLRGQLGDGFSYDLSNTFGISNADFWVRRTANLSLGPTSPTSFYAGRERYEQDVSNLTFTRRFPIGVIAAGAEYRYEWYGIASGDPASTTGAGAQGFPGFNPRIPVGNDRTAEAGFLDAELTPVSWASVGGTVRYDHYSDFGGAATWKLRGRAEAAPWLAFRGSISTGFRAPSLQQEYYSSITTVANGANKALVNVGTFQVNDPVAKALGAEPLRAETSRDASVGLELIASPSLWFTLDVFRTDIDNRIALADALSGPAVIAALASAGVTNVQQVAFFTNAISTRTQGFDATANYRGRIGEDARFGLSLSYERSPTSTRRLGTNPAIPALGPLLGTHSRLLLTEAQPFDRLAFAGDLDDGPWSLSLNVNRYGKYVDAPIKDPQTFGAKTIVDLAANWRFPNHVRVRFGVLNVGDVHPDPLKEAALAFATFGGSYVYGEESPFGVDGRSYYLGVRYDF